MLRKKYMRMQNKYRIGPDPSGETRRKLTTAQWSETQNIWIRIRMIRRIRIRIKVMRIHNTGGRVPVIEECYLAPVPFFLQTNLDGFLSFRTGRFFYLFRGSTDSGFLSSLITLSEHTQHSTYMNAFQKPVRIYHSHYWYICISRRRNKPSK